MTKKNELTEVAAKYKEFALKIKEIEKQANPLKKRLTDYAKGLALDTLEIGGVTIEKRTSSKASIDANSVTPDWLYRMQTAGKYDLLNIGIDKEAIGDGDAYGLLCEVGFEAKESVTYAIRI